MRYATSRSLISIPYTLTMLYIFYGTDTEKVQRRARALVDGLLAKRPDATLTTLESTTLVPALDELTSAQGLFVEKHIVYLRAPLETADSKAYTLERIPALAQSDNIFVLALGAVDAKTKKLLEKHSAKTEVHDKKEQPKENLFFLGDLLAARDRKQLWVAYTDVLSRGHAPEEVHGILFWAAKSMLLAAHSKSAEEAGQKPYVYSKFRRGSANYSLTELAAMSEDLVRLYHEAHEGRYDLGTALEQWLLTR